VYKAVQSSRLYERIIEQIEESILKGSLKTGDQLPAERELAQQFGVSRTAVREAVKALREKGLVEAYSGRGTFVTNGTSQAIRHSLDLMTRINQQDGLAHLVEAYSGRGTFVTNGTSQAIRHSLDLMTRINQQDGLAHLVEVREILEPEIAAMAAIRMDRQQPLANMREAVAVMDRALKDLDAYIEADLGFHLALAEAAQNPIILSLIDSIVGLLREQRARIFYVEGGPERGQFHHKRILQALEQRDPERSRDAMRAHLQQVREDSRVSTSTPDATSAKSIS